MSDDTVQIKRYPNRRFYARSTSKYVSLLDIGDMIQAGQNVEIRDSQTNEDLTRAVLTQIIVDRHPDKMSLFPTDMLHSILRSNDAMTDFLRDYFRHSLTYLDYLQKHGAAPATMAQPMHWAKAWLDAITPRVPSKSDDHHGESKPASKEPLADRIAQLEARLAQLESKEE